MKHFLTVLPKGNTTISKENIFELSSSLFTRFLSEAHSGSPVFSYQIFSLSQRYKTPEIISKTKVPPSFDISEEAVSRDARGDCQETATGLPRFCSFVRGSTLLVSCKWTIWPAKSELNCSNNNESKQDKGLFVLYL